MLRRVGKAKLVAASDPRTAEEVEAGLADVARRAVEEVEAGLAAVSTLEAIHNVATEVFDSRVWTHIQVLMAGTDSLPYEPLFWGPLMIDDLDRDVLLREIDAKLRPYTDQSDDNAIQLLLGQRVGVAFGDSAPPFWTRVREEFRRFLCSDDKVYVKEREIIRQRGREGTAVLVGMLAGAIVTATGVGTVTLLAPFVALLLFQALTIGVRAYCADKKGS